MRRTTSPSEVSAHGLELPAGRDRRPPRRGAGFPPPSDRSGDRPGPPLPPASRLFLAHSRLWIILLITDFFFKRCFIFFYRIVCQELTLHTQRGLAGLQKVLSLVGFEFFLPAPPPLLLVWLFGCCHCVVAVLKGDGSELESKEVKSRILVPRFQLVPVPVILRFLFCHF